MTVIRGATTIEQDTPENIQVAVQELLEGLFACNQLQKEEICAFVFSLTTDIHSYHPAKAARECGYDFAPLFAAIEPEIDGGLKRCIRLMLLTELNDKRAIKHVYQKEAKTLRKDISAILNIALDGPAGSGKSTVALQLAKKLNFNLFELDEIFEDENKIKIKDYFEQFGEESFRKKESEILSKALQIDYSILSCGGGIILKKENRDKLFSDNVITIYLKTSSETLFERLKKDTTRPLLQVDNPQEEIKKILTSREEYYNLADIIIERN